MDGDYVGEPERNVGEIVGQDFLGFTAGRFPFFLIHFGTDLVGERVNARVAVVSTVGAIGREAFAGEGELEEIRVVIGAYPAEVGELKIAFGDVGEERGDFEGAKLEFDAGAPPLFLESGADEAGLLFGGGLEREMEADAVGLAGEAGGVKELFGAGEIGGVLGDVGFVRPVIGREDAVAIESYRDEAWEILPRMAGRRAPVAEGTLLGRW